MLVSAVACFAQAELSEKEQNDLRDAVSETSNSPIEFIRALEGHLKKYPDSPRKADMERGIVKAAMELKDHRRIAIYGERVLASSPDDAMLLEVVSRGLLANNDKASAQRALKYSLHAEELWRAREKEDPGPGMRGKAREEIDGALGRCYVYSARASGNLEKLDDAIAFARKSYEANPTAESAREISRWLERSGKTEDAIVPLADAFAIADPKVTEAQRATDRKRLGELYRKTHESEKGLGDVVLVAYDRTAILLAGRRNRLRAVDPNALATEPLDFTLSSLKGERLDLSSLKGKVIVMDFWATWCGPCRAQKPLYDQVKKSFGDKKDVVFLAVSTDEDRALVEPFLTAQKWSKSVYFEDGLANAMRISSIPTTVVFNKRGEIVSRMNGFVADRFVEMLSERIREALTE
jgi:thiol-disulfide isomerase/thioredoxin